MARMGMLLIATMLAGGPAVPLVCELWCGTPAAETHHRAARCHDDSEGPPTIWQVASAGGCHDDAAAPPYLTATRHQESGAGFSALPRDEASGVATGAGAMTAAWRALDFHPSRPSAAHLVLRI